MLGGLALVDVCHLVELALVAVVRLDLRQRLAERALPPHPVLTHGGIPLLARGAREMPLCRHVARLPADKRTRSEEVCCSPPGGRAIAASPSTAG